MTRRVLGVLTTAAVALAAAPAAQAAFDVTEFSVTPSSPKAGANADVTIVTGFPAYQSGQPAPEQAKSIVFHLPPGLAGDPFATRKCTEAQFRDAACPAGSQVGEVAAEATALLAGLIPTPTTAAGGVFNLKPQGSEPARLGAVLQPATPGADPLFVPTLIRVRPADGGLDSVVPELPRSATVGGLSVPVYTSKMTFTLYGKPPGAARPFMRNPTSCKPATTTLEATSYTEGSAAVKRTSAFTPADCGALPFAPAIAATIGGNGKTARGARPTVRTVVSQATGQAGQSSVAVTLPGVLGVDLTRLAVACAPELALSRGCPAGTRVGSVTAGTPLLAAPLGGSVFLTANPAGGLPKLTIQLDDPIPLRLDGTPELTPQGLKTTFTGLPDVPLTRFQLDLDGVFENRDDLCALDAPPPVAAAFAAHSGAASSATAPVAVAGCTPPPSVKVRISRLKSGKPRLKVAVAAAAGAPGLTRVDVSLPTALKVKKRKRVAASAGTAALSRDGELRVDLPAGTRSMTAKLRKGALKVSRKLRRARKPRRQDVLVRIRDADGLRPPVALKVKPKRGA